jgi:hypothetical protein
MAELTLHAVQWCSQHGHPVLALRTTDDRFFVVALSAEDAGALAAWPGAGEAERPARRLHGLVEATVAALGGRLTEVHLHVGSDAMLRASLRLHGPEGEFALPANFADGVALAHRGRLPLRMDDEDLGRVPLTSLTASAPAREPQTPPDVFRAVIESLDLDGFESGGASA